MAEAIAPENCQFPFLLDEKPAVVPLRFGRRAVARCARGTLWRLRWQPVLAPQIVWNRSTRLAHARGGARAGRPRWPRILTITDGSWMAAMAGEAVRRFGQRAMSMSRSRLSSGAQLMRGVS